MATINNIQVYKNEDITIPFVMNPVRDITGWGIQFTLKKRQKDVATLVVKTVGSGVAIPLGTDGKFRLSLSSADTTLPAKDYYYDIQRTDFGSHVVLSVGTFTILQEVKVP